MKYLLFLLSAFIPFTFSFAESQKLVKNDFTTWPRAQAKEFGCFLEKEFKVKDKKFNCSLKTYVNNGDPCINTTQYYEGPVFPNQKSSQVNPRIKDIAISWEHGDLQNVSVVVYGKHSEKDLKKDFKLPDSASVQDCGKDVTCIVLNGFDHQGAGDIDCGEVQ